jgi:hypothetical protein
MVIGTALNPTADGRFIVLTRIKQLSRSAIASLTSLGLWSAWAFAQDPTTSSGTTTTTTTTTVWYSQWWAWAAGVAVFLIIVIALTNRGGRSSA